MWLTVELSYRVPVKSVGISFRGMTSSNPVGNAMRHDKFDNIDIWIGNDRISSWKKTIFTTLSTTATSLAYSLCGKFNSPILKQWGNAEDKTQTYYGVMYVKRCVQAHDGQFVAISREETIWGESLGLVVGEVVVDAG